MKDSIALKKYGIELRVRGKKILLDPRKDHPSDLVFISHAHKDHMFKARTATPKICSEETEELVNFRRGVRLMNVITKPEFELNRIKFKRINSGHIIGSNSLLVESNKRYLYTGDVCDKDRFHLKGADLPESDVLIIESTYGEPAYSFPSIKDLREDIESWILESLESGISPILLGYELGKSQVLMKMVDDLDFPKIVPSSLSGINKICESFGFSSKSEFKPFSRVKRIMREPFIGVFPTFYRNYSFLNEMREEGRARTSIFTGWSVNPFYKHMMSCDFGFPLSDHSDFDGLLRLVEKVEPERVYTVHGFSSSLAREIEERLGIDSVPLAMKGQTRLKRFLTED